jgi:outer membrane protein assembly factor BamB
MSFQRLCVCFSMWLACLAGSLVAEEVRFFRHDSGIGQTEKPLPENFDGKSQLTWRVPLAPGHSTPCLYGDSIYVTTFEDGKLFTIALARADGSIRWKQPAPAERIESYHATGSPAAATPACDGKRVYSFFGSYGLLCYDLTGKLVWQKELGPFQDEFGSASSPILVDGRLLLAEDHDADSFLLCLDAASGKTLWRTPREGLRSYSTPVVWNVGGRKAIAVAGALVLTAYDLDSGQPLWSIDGLARIVNTTPVINGNRMFVATWTPGADSGGRIRMDAWADASPKWDADHDGKITRTETDNAEVLDRFYRIDTNQDKGLDETEWTRYSRVFDRAQNSIIALDTNDPRTRPSVVWQYDRGIPYVPSPLVYRDIVYLIKEGGVLTSLDAHDGKLLKQGRAAGSGGYYASPVAADGKVLLLSERGVLTVLAAKGQWSVLSSHDFGERSMATPVIDDGQVFIRTEAALYSFSNEQ